MSGCQYSYHMHAGARRVYQLTLSWSYSWLGAIICGCWELLQFSARASNAFSGTISPACLVYFILFFYRLGSTSGPRTSFFFCFLLFCFLFLVQNPVTESSKGDKLQLSFHSRLGVQTRASKPDLCLLVARLRKTQRQK